LERFSIKAAMAGENIELLIVGDGRGVFGSATEGAK